MWNRIVRIWIGVCSSLVFEELGDQCGRILSNVRDGSFPENSGR